MALATDHHQQLQQRRSKKSKNGQKKQPQRGLGVAQLERLRIEEESKKVMLASSSFVPGSCFQGGHGRVSALCLSNPPLHLHHHLAVAAQAPGGSLRNSINVPLVSLGASARQGAPQSHYKDPNLGNISQHSSIHRRDQSSSLGGLLGKIQAAATADSSSCKSGISSDASAAAVAASHPLFGTGRSSSSPSPCSSSKPDHILDEGGDEASKAASPPFLFLPSSSSCSSETKSSKNATMMSAFRQLIQPGSSNTKNTPDASESFDPSFRRARRLHGDCRDWPGIRIPAIKELSSFQIPGNTTPALSSGNRTCFTGVRDGSADRVSGYSVSVDKGSSSVKLIGSSPSPTSLSAASSLARSEVCFAFEQQLKDSCSSSLKNSSNGLEATSSTKAACDFLTLGLSSPEACSDFHKRPKSRCGLPDSKSAAADDDESSKFVVTPQEASGETDDHWKFPRKSIKLQRSSSPFTLELSLKVPSIEDSSLELKLAL